MKAKEMEEEELQLLDDIINRTYSNTTFTSRLYDMFSKRDDAVAAYIKPDREFWYYDGDKGCYRKLRVTYVRTGVMFFEFEDEPQVEHAWFVGSFNSMTLYAAQIYPYEIGEIMAKYCDGADINVPKICKQCRWDDCNGNIDVTVVWDKLNKEG